MGELTSFFLYVLASANSKKYQNVDILNTKGIVALTEHEKVG